MSNNLFDPARQPTELMDLPISDDVKIAMIWCPPGEFLMGSKESAKFSRSGEYPQRHVQLTNGFWIGSTPVTCEQWQVCMDNNIFYPPQKGFPVAGVTWTDTKSFGNKLTTLLLEQGTIQKGQSFNLPSEAQWEYACRAGTTSTWYFGDDPNRLKDHAYYRDNSKHNIAPVRQKLPNPWGIYDLYGNVYEWCLDNSYGYSQHVDKTVNPIIQYDDTIKSYKAVRGGCCNSMADDCRSAARYFRDAFNEMGDPIGLRLVLMNV
jgi:formylglycine-generating enzyme required for sulfatase activity